MQIFHSAELTFSSMHAVFLCCGAGGPDGARTGYSSTRYVWYTGERVRRSRGLGCVQPTALLSSTDCVSAAAAAAAAAAVWFEWGRRTSAAALTLASSSEEWKVTGVALIPGT